MTISSKSWKQLGAEFLAGLLTQVRASLSVGLASEETSRPREESCARDCLSSTRGSIRSMDDYAGYHTNNGLGSLDIGGGSSRWGE